jgi:hypothetical protein
MPLNELELQNLRHLIGGHETIANKLQTYADQCTDTQIKQMLQKDAQDAQTHKLQLLNFLA